MIDTLQDFFNETSIIDFLYLLVTGISLIQCYKKGFVLSVLSMAKWIMAYVITLILFPRVKPYFKDIIEKLLRTIGEKRLMIPFPLKLAEFSARFFELMPNPLLTRDQLRLLKYDNIKSGKYKTNFDIGTPSLRYFDEEVKKYS